ncbi:hypothetical protein MHU86_25021 [Fragilaria crotonensis]|nr:hypothetical protein MHU86_25021 [Fragilaria crotonensis]
MARAMLLHSAAHWKNGVDSSLWPMAVSYAVYVYNNTPNAQNLCPADLFTGSTVPRHRLRDLHTWGCPVYVLDPSLQAGKKLPRWEPRSRRGVFVGLSTIHSSEVPLILNLATGSITPQYHVVFDDRYSTVTSIGSDDDPPSDWDDLCLDNSLYVPTDTAPDTPVHLHDDWLTDAEREVKYRDLQRQDRVRNLQHPQPSTPTSLLVPSAQPPSHTSSEGDVPPIAPTTATQQQTLPKFVSVAPEPLSGVCSGPVMGPDVVTSDSTVDQSLRRSTRATKEHFNQQSILTKPILRLLIVSHNAIPTRLISYLAEISTCCDTGIENVVDPRAYAAKTPGSDPDMPTFHQAVNGEHAEEWIRAMQLEVETLVQQRTWTMVPRTAKINVLKSTWAFKLKRLPDGTPSLQKLVSAPAGLAKRELISSTPTLQLSNGPLFDFCLAPF